MTKFIDNIDIYWYNSDTMTKYMLNSFSNIDFQLGVDKAAHKMDFPEHTNDFTELTIVTSETVINVVEDINPPIQRISVMSVSPFFSHQYKDVDNLKHYNFIFDVNKLNLIDSELRKLKGFQAFFITLPRFRYRHKFISNIVLNDEQLPFVKNLCELIYTEFISKSEGYKILVGTYFLSLITYILNLYDPAIENVSESVIKIVNTATYIEENYASKITVPMLARLAFLSERQYLRVFKSVYNVTPIRYINDCRLDHACNFITTNTKTLSEISDICGFSDKSAFSKLFFKQFGISPSQYRKNILSNIKQQNEFGC